ncbi:betaine-aldehyde dehydrogenase [Arthrobacter sp. MYb227]|uniref:aldehyde dehydrogenase family protein n=1 Tax=Arthrobacter sp. MYb227 TaxID=1848601 RepID=UPI000CFB714D|nr:aldehyde dehydrogenase family protein [Arthrobacter sp. MYb227]PQZ94955.1 betaine-aldehyde dehydrogenase [Arthrobacter sp. MYb227]
MDLLEELGAKSQQRANIGGLNRHHIGGQWVESASGAVFTAINPATGERIADLAEANAAEIDAAVDAARTALESPAWGGMLPNQRGELLWRLADLIDFHRDELARLESLDQGQPVGIAANMSAAGAAAHFRYYAGWTTKLDGRVPSVSRADAMLYTQRIPVGVCGLITPWNFPLLIAAWKLAPALATGNTVVLKPAEQTSLTTLRLMEIMEDAGFPRGVVNVVTGGGSTGRLMVEHPGIDKVSFTGSTAVGRSIVRGAAGNLKRVSLELGGKAASIVCQDADLEKSVPKNIANVTNNSGQVCGALSRFYVHESRYEEFVERSAAILGGLKIGPGLAAGTQMGPLNSEEHLNRVDSLVAGALDAGAQAVVGGGRLGGSLAAGSFYAPTLLTGVEESMDVAREEIFGPVMPVMTYSDEEEVLARVNDSEYGLSASVWTENLGRGHRMAQRISAGAVRVNTVSGLDPAAPWGGLRSSGWGREMGEEALEAYTEVKATWIGLD